MLRREPASHWIVGCRFFSGHFWLIMVDYYDFYCLFSGFSGGHFTCFFQSFTIKECLKERGRWSFVGWLSGAPLRSFFLAIYRVSCDWASNRILFFRILSGIFHFGFRQNLIIKDAGGDLSKPGGASVLWRTPPRSYYSEDLSGILHLGFQQDLNFKGASGDLGKPEGISATKGYPTGSSFFNF